MPTEVIRDALWGAPTLALLLGFGGYFTVRLGLWTPKGIYDAFRRTFFAPKRKGDGNNLSSLSAIATALGGTVGVGSISGVALAISVGGAGSVFWMWVCSFLGIGLKYAEVAVAHSRRRLTKRGYSGGAMYCLKAMGYSRLGALFALLCVLSAGLGGSTVQANSAAEVLAGAVDNSLIRGALIALITLTVISGGRKRIGRVNAALLPFISLGFCFLCLWSIICHAHLLPHALCRIFGEALGLRQAAGGIGAAAMLRVGCVRGTFSHEAGMGSSPISYAAAEERDPHVQGLWGVTEVFIDSFVVSTLVAFAVLCTGQDTVRAVFEHCFGGFGSGFYSVALFFFAFAAIISWCFYGEEAVFFLFPKSACATALFRLFIAVGAFWGALMPEGKSFAVADIWGALMLFPNLFLLYKSRSEIVAFSQGKGFGRAKGGKQSTHGAYRRGGVGAA
ncbi:MAG: sodium:alanine symporter family protein [Clostridia bacterium]|nr:sodium:alanine symporter family protein [Clostridia bacterium]